MQIITTYNGMKLGLVKVSKSADKFELHKFPSPALLYLNVNVCKVKLPKGRYEIIGTTSTLTDEQVEPFIEVLEQDEGITTYKDYLPTTDLCCCTIPLESFNSLLEANNIDLSKEWVVLQIKND